MSAPDEIVVDGVAYRITEGPVVTDHGDGRIELAYRVAPAAETIEIQIVRSLEDEPVEVVTVVAGTEPGSLAYAEAQAELAGDLDQETEEETR